MKRSHRNIAIGLIVVLLYVITGIYGPRRHLAQMRSNAQKIYEKAIERENAKADYRKQNSLEPRKSRLFPEGPIVGIKWAVPILPGVLIANTYEAYGGLWGHGGPCLVFYLGFVTFSIPGPIGWIA